MCALGSMGRRGGLCHSTDAWTRAYFSIALLLLGCFSAAHAYASTVISGREESNTLTASVSALKSHDGQWMGIHSCPGFHSGGGLCPWACRRDSVRVVWDASGSPRQSLGHSQWVQFAVEGLLKWPPKPNTALIYGMSPPPSSTISSPLAFSERNAFLRKVSVIVLPSRSSSVSGEVGCAKVFTLSSRAREDAQMVGICSGYYAVVVSWLLL